MSYNSKDNLLYVSQCKDYSKLKDLLTDNELSEIDQILYDFNQYQVKYDDGEKDIISEYEQKYGNANVIDWYEGIKDTESFLDDFIDRYKTYQDYHQLQRKAKKAYFSCDDENIYEGYYFDNMSWNGWKVPFFTKETVDKIAENLQDEFYELEYDSSKKEYILIDKVYMDIDNPSQDPKEYSETYSADTLIYEGQEIQVYAIGGFLFAWDLCNDKNILKENLEINEESELEL